MFVHHLRMTMSVKILVIFLTVPLVRTIYIPQEQDKDKTLTCNERQKEAPDPFTLQCGDDGSFKTLQCDHTTDTCYCAHPGSGTVFFETAVPSSDPLQEGQDCEKYWQEKDAQAENDVAVPMLMSLAVDPPVGITALSNDVEEVEDKNSAVKITSINQVNLPLKVNLEEHVKATSTKEVTNNDTDVTFLNLPIAVPVLYKSEDDQNNKTDAIAHPVPVLYDKLPNAEDIRIDADNYTTIPEVKPTEDIPPVDATLCNKTTSNCSHSYFNITSSPIEATAEYGEHDSFDPPVIQQSHVAKLEEVPEKSYLFDLRVTSMQWKSSLENKSSEEYVSMENRCHKMMLPLFSELPGFLALKILGFKEGSIIVEHEALFDYVRATSSEDVSSRLRHAVEGGRLDPNMTFDSLTIYDDVDINLCEYARCEDHSQCVVPPGERVPICRCHTGYGSLDGSGCTSRCELEPGYCHNDGRCDVEPELGVICRCRAGASWWHVGERCETYMSYFMVFSIGGGAVGGVFVIMLLAIVIVAKRVPNRTKPSDYFPSHYRRPFFIEANGSTVRSGPSSFSENTWKDNPMFIDDHEEDIYSTISRKAGQEISRELRELEATDIEDPYGIIGMFAKAESISTAGTKLPPGDWNGVVRFKPTVECIDPNWKFKIKRPRYVFNPEYDQQRDDLSWP